MEHENHKGYGEEYGKKSSGKKNHDHEKMMKMGGSMDIMKMIAMKNCAK